MSPKSTAKVLPLERLRLYETGVGYFERSGELHGATRTTLPVPAGHIDDALKTLTIAAKGGKAHVAGVSFPSSLSEGMARSLAWLSPRPSGRPVAFKDVLLGLRGQPVEVQLASGTLKGAVIAVSEVQQPAARKGAPPQKHTVLLFLDEHARVQRIELESVLSLRPLAVALRARLEIALTALTKNGRLKRRALELLSSAKGPITLGYIAEAPLYRVSYRLVAGAARKQQTLQGWALVHNDSDEDWRGVEVSLVSGRPDSFLFPLAVPRYARRPLVHPTRALPSVPQLINTSPDAMWGDQLDGDSIGESYGVGGLGITGTGRGGGGSGYGTIGMGKLGTIGGATLKVGNLAAFSKAKTKKTSTLFRYGMTRPLDLDAHSSALLPFTQVALSAEKITLVDGYGEKARATVLLENSTAQTLPAGTIAFYDDGIFVGESFLPRTKPHERRFLEHGTDLDVKVTRLSTESDEATKKIVGQEKVLVEQYLRTREVELKLQNLDGAPRRVFLRVHAVMNAKIEGADALDFDRVRGRAYAIFMLAPHSKSKKKLVITEGLSRTIDPGSVDIDTLKKIAKRSTTSSAQRAALTRLLEKRAALKAHETRTSENRQARARLKRTLQRLRQHLSALGAKGTRGADPLVRRVLATEDKLAAAQKKADALRKEKKKLEGELAVLAKQAATTF